jgi:hypothetical protein
MDAEVMTRSGTPGESARKDGLRHSWCKMPQAEKNTRQNLPSDAGPAPPAEKPAHAVRRGEQPEQVKGERAERSVANVFTLFLRSAANHEPSSFLRLRRRRRPVEDQHAAAFVEPWSLSRFKAWRFRDAARYSSSCRARPLSSQR